MNHPPIVGADSTDSSAFPISYWIAHQQGTIHRSVHVEIRDDRDRILVMALTAGWKYLAAT